MKKTRRGVKLTICLFAPFSGIAITSLAIPLFSESPLGHILLALQVVSPRRFLFRSHSPSLIRRFPFSSGVLPLRNLLRHPRPTSLSNL